MRNHFRTSAQSLVYRAVNGNIRRMNRQKTQKMAVVRHLVFFNLNFPFCHCRQRVIPSTLISTEVAASLQQKTISNILNDFT